MATVIKSIISGKNFFNFLSEPIIKPCKIKIKPVGICLIVYDQILKNCKIFPNKSALLF